MNNYPKGSIFYTLKEIMENIAHLANNKLIFTTSSGIIIGELVTPEELEETRNKISQEILTIDMTHSSMQQFNKNNESKDKILLTDFLFLKNVTILNSGDRIPLSSFTLFVDSITGFSIGNL